MVPVYCKVLEPKNVQETNGPARVLHFLGRGLINGCIDLVHDPHEEPPVDALNGEAAAKVTASQGDRPDGDPPWASEASLQPLPAAGNPHVFSPAVLSAWSTLSCLNNICLFFKALWRYQLHQETSPSLPWKFRLPPLQPSLSPLQL